MKDYTIWLEFEHVDYSNSDMENELANVIIDFTDGRHYGINVWTYKFLYTLIELSKKEGTNLNGLYMEPPDLFVKELTRDCIEKTIADLLKTDSLEKMLNPSVLSASETSDDE